ncbi:glycosyltransferase family 2 protein [Soonwooa sp.]|uniref:glycosyltransferase family A protein n=1 Tax=Soonwooa sp. TaxID=1938592 RepID=UPI00262CB8DD|nr:glycosyltransferase family 2 protein [Soonwooa sp.]
MNSPKITIVTPTFNRAHTLERSYESLKKQSFRDFKWIIMDDGSSDNTKDLVEQFKSENIFDIDYFWNENRHKFITVFEGIKKVTSPYFMILDSDDTYPENALQILFDESEKIQNQADYIGIIGLSADENGNVVGDKFPVEFDGSIFDMRYKYKVRGDKNGIFFTKTYHRYLDNFDYQKYKGKGYIPQTVFFNTYDSQGIKTRFINKVIRYYHFDEADQQSVSNTRWSGKNTFGLMEGYRSFLNCYHKQLNSYPKTLLKNLIGYQTYSLINNKNLSEINAGISNFKFLSTLIYPLSLIYKKTQ